MTGIQLPNKGSMTVLSSANWNDVVNAIDALNAANVFSFGALGNGVTDDTAFIQAAANAVPSAGGILYLPKPPTYYVLTAPIYLKSGTRVVGDGYSTHIVASVNWVVSGSTYYCFFTNVNRTSTFNPTSIVDYDITIESLYCDYGAFAPIGPAGKHAIEMLGVQNLIVRNCKFSAGNLGNDGIYHGENATAFLGCNNTLIDGCTALNFANCSYDHWCGPQNARLVNSYAITKTSSCQMVNFNPEPTTGSAAGLAGNGFVMANCTLICTGASACSMQLEPLGAGTTVTNVSVHGNTFVNVALAIRRASRNVSVTGNTFAKNVGGGPVFACYPIDGDTPDAVSFVGNTLIDPDTNSANNAVIVLGGTNSSVLGNVLSGSAFYSALDTMTFAVVVIGNNFSAGAPGYQISGTAWSTGGVPLRIPNGVPFCFYDTTGAVMTLELQGDNNFVLAGTNASGGARVILSCQQENSTTPLIVGVPLTVMSGITFSVPAVQGPTISAGLGAPGSNTPGFNIPASIYLREDGSVGSHIYVASLLGAWNALAGV